MKNLNAVMLCVMPLFTFGQTNNLNIAGDSIHSEFQEKYFFQFTEVEHYHIMVDEMEIHSEFVEQETLSVDEFLLMNIVLGERPKSISDSSIIQRLEGIGFVRRTLEPKKHPIIRNVFREREIPKTDEIRIREVYFCEPVFRDIIVFRNYGRVIGIAKICTDCHKSRIIGTAANVSEFGQNKEFEQLETILDSKM